MRIPFAKKKYTLVWIFFSIFNTMDVNTIDCDIDSQSEGNKNIKIYSYYDDNFFKKIQQFFKMLNFKF